MNPTVCIHLAPKSSHKRARLVENIPHGFHAKQRGTWQPVLTSSSCEYWSARQANSLHPPRTEKQPQACSTGRSDPWLLKCKAKRKAAASVGKQANTQTVCIRLHQRAAASLPCPTSWSDHWRLSCKPKRKAAAWVGKHLLRVSTKQANNLHPPRTEEQPQACSTGRRSLTAPVPSKEEGGECSLC